MSTDILPIDSLRRTRSTGDLPIADIPRPDRAQTAPHRYSESHTNSSGRMPPLISTTTDDPVNSPVTDTSVIPPRLMWSPINTVVEVEEHDRGDPAPDNHIDTGHRRNRGLYGDILAFFGFGSASESRRELVSLIFTLVWSSLQIVAIITVLVFAAHIRSPNFPDKNEWQACNKPLGVWCCFWISRSLLACVLAYWSWVRDRARVTVSDPESNDATHTHGNQSSPLQNTTRGTGRNTASSTRTPGTPNSAVGADVTPPRSRLFNRFTLLYSLMTLTWFLTAHVLEYTSISSCRHNSPHLWWLTFSILSIMYLKILEIAFLGFAVFIVAPIVFLFWNILLICLGRHPLQNPATMIKPEIERLPKSVVDSIPLVMYIPPPPDEPANEPVTFPAPVHAYPPKPPVTPPPKRRFRFLKRKTAKDQKTADGSAAAKGDASKEKKRDEPQTWEDCWEQGEYPFVRLEGNRAACAICLLDFAEPRRVGNLAASTNGNTQTEKSVTETTEGAVQEVHVSHVIEEDRDGELKLADAGEGPQPLRLLQCGHVFHKTCLDPWLQDVSGRCPLCQRPVSIPEPEQQRRRRRR